MNIRSIKKIVKPEFVLLGSIEYRVCIGHDNSSFSHLIVVACWTTKKLQTARIFSYP